MRGHAGMNPELDAIRERYARRAGRGGERRYSFLDPGNLAIVHERQRAMLRLLAGAGFVDLPNLKLVEVGAGTGGNLLELMRVGFAPQNLMGIELLEERVAAARGLLPAALRFESGDATTLAVAPGSFDIVYQSVVFSSLLDDDFQTRLARAMWQWLRPGGAVLWYDLMRDNPYNQDVRGVPLARVRELFPSARIRARRVTLAPPVARRVARVHPTLYTAFNLLPLLRTHLLAWIAKP